MKRWLQSRKRHGERVPTCSPDRQSRDAAKRLDSASMPPIPDPSLRRSSIGSWPAARATAGSAIRWKRRSPRDADDAVRSSRIRTDWSDRVRRAIHWALKCPALSPLPSPLSPRLLIDGKPWRRIGFSTQLACEDCGIEYPPPEPRLYSFNSPLGACPECEGFGNVIGIDMELVVPDPGKSLREGAIAPWNTPAYAHELKELLALARDYDIPMDVPFRELSERHVGI